MHGEEELEGVGSKGNMYVPCQGLNKGDWYY